MANVSYSDRYSFTTKEGTHVELDLVVNHSDNDQLWLVSYYPSFNEIKFGPGDKQKLIKMAKERLLEVAAKGELDRIGWDKSKKLKFDHIGVGAVCFVQV